MPWNADDDCVRSEAGGLLRQRFGGLAPGGPESQTRGNLAEQRLSVAAEIPLEQR